MGNYLMSDKELRDVCDKVATAILELDPYICESVDLLSDYYFAHPSELQEAIQDCAIELEV
jgi:hypothetical protein